MMRGGWIISACVLAMAGCAAPGPAAGNPAIAFEPPQGDAYPGVEVTFADGVRGIAAIPYWTPRSFRPLTLDLYLPAKPVKRPAAGFPLVVYVHGGAWVGGGARRLVPFADFPGVLASLAERGYVVASVDYRLSGEARYPAQAQDIKAAIRFLRLHAREYGIDPTRAMTWGVSAGGHLAAIANVTCKVPELAPQQIDLSGVAGPRPDVIVDADVSDCVQGAVAWFGVFDLTTIADQARTVGALSRENAGAPEWRLLGCFKDQCPSDSVRLASPVSFVKTGTPPMLLVVGDADATVPYYQSIEMADRFKAAGAAHELIVIPGVGHNFIGKTDDQTRDANYKALLATFAFIDKTMGVGQAPSAR